MENVKFNEQAVQQIIQWDPLGYGPESYETEAADIVAALQQQSDAAQLAETIQTVFRFSYEETIPLAACLQMAQALLSMKQ